MTETTRADAFRPGPRLVLFSSTDERSTRRTPVLSMRPMDPTHVVTDLPAPGRAVGPGQVFWAHLLADDSPQLMRAADLPDADEARADADRLFAQATDLRIVYVRDQATGRLAWWLTLDDVPVLVPARVWGPSHRHAVVRDAKRAVATMAAQPPWGDYDPR